MGNETRVSIVMLAGSLATLCLLLFGPLLARWHGAPLPAGTEGALATLFTVALAWFLPAELLTKLHRRTRRRAPRTP